jgi:hypothetical protein
MRLVKKCCLCQREYYNEEWHLPGRKTEDTVYTHGFCPDCYKVTVDALERNSQASLQSCFNEALAAQQKVKHI